MKSAAKSRDLLGLDVIGAVFSKSAPAKTTFVSTQPKPVMTTTAPPATATQTFTPKPTMTTAAPTAPVVPKPTMSTTAAPVTAAEVFTPKPTMSTTAPTAPAVPTPKTPMTSGKPLDTQRAIDSAKKAADEKAAKAKAQENAKRAVQKLLAAAGRTAKKAPKRAQKLTSIANTIKQRASIAGDPFGNILGELLGNVDYGGTGFGMNATSLTATQFMDFEANVDALIILTEVANAADDLAEKLTTAGFTSLAGIGTRIAADCDALLDIVKNDPEKNVGARVNAISANANSWTAQANAALANPVEPPPVDPPVDTGPPGGGGAGAGGEGGEDPGAGEGEGGNPFDDLQPGGAGSEGALNEEAAPEAQPEGGEESAPADPGYGDAGASPAEHGSEASSVEETPAAEESSAGYTDEATVTAVQNALAAKGFPVGEDGDMAKAIRLFQASTQLPETGIIDDALLAALEVPPPVPDAGSSDPFASTGTYRDDEDVRGDPFAAIVGQMLGRAAAPAKKPLIVPAKSTQVIPKPPSSAKAWLQKPMWTGSKVLIWHGFVGAGSGLALSGILYAVLRRKR